MAADEYEYIIAECTALTVLEGSAVCRANGIKGNLKDTGYMTSSRERGRNAYVQLKKTAENTDSWKRRTRGRPPAVANHQRGSSTNE